MPAPKFLSQQLMCLFLTVLKPFIYKIFFAPGRPANKASPCFLIHNLPAGKIQLSINFSIINNTTKNKTQSI